WVGAQVEAGAELDDVEVPVRTDPRVDRRVQAGREVDERAAWPDLDHLRRAGGEGGAGEQRDVDRAVAADRDAGWDGVALGGTLPRRVGRSAGDPRQHADQAEATRRVDPEDVVAARVGDPDRAIRRLGDAVGVALDGEA